MDTKKRKKELETVFSGVKDEERLVLQYLIDDVVYLEERMEALKKLPFLKIHPTRPELQKQTSAAKQYKECSQSYMNAVRILLSVLRKTDEDAAAELMKRLEDFA